MGCCFLPTSPGTELRLVERQSGWVELIDPATRMRGWMLESYVSLLGGPGNPQVAMDTPAEPQLSKPTPAKRALRARQDTRPVKSGPQVADAFAEKRELQRGRWARRDERRRRVGLFGRRFATFANVP